MPAILSQMVQEKSFAVTVHVKFVCKFEILLKLKNIFSIKKVNC